VIVQLALDRVSIDEAIRLGTLAEPYVDWIEVGTSLIKEFGMTSVRELRRAFPGKPIVADMKTFDNARYEFALCYRAGADVATVMGAAPAVSIDACLETARDLGGEVMIDLLNVSAEQMPELLRRSEAIVCAHLSKDQQELSGGGAAAGAPLPGLAALTRLGGPRLAVAGGISAASLGSLGAVRPDVLIVGGAITQAADPAAAARDFREALRKFQEGGPT
jgi:3-hexulose-6-phosphate synthase